MVPPATSAAILSQGPLGDWRGLLLTLLLLSL